MATGYTMRAMSERTVTARLVLEDGAFFTGTAFACSEAPVTGFGEVVFNTAMTGYQEALTDPSYLGQILVMTAPQIGNYGTNDDDVESVEPQVAGFVIREASRVDSNFRSVSMLGQWLTTHGIPAITGIDTRALVRRLRSSGVMRGVLTTDEARPVSDLLEAVRSSASMTGRNLAAEACESAGGGWADGLGPFATMNDDVYERPDRPYRVVAIDCGAKRNIFRHLVDKGCEIITVPWNVTADEIRANNPEGLFVSNGPGDPAAVEPLIETLREVAGEVPTFGICLGHQLLALALGASTWKLPFGHRGANQPVRNMETGQVEITSQNHGFCVDWASLEALDCQVTHVHLNDRTVAGFRHSSKPIFAVQYHPEASPGPHDSAYLFEHFTAQMAKVRGEGEGARTPSTTSA